MSWAIGLFPLITKETFSRRSPINNGAISKYPIQISTILPYFLPSYLASLLHLEKKWKITSIFKTNTKGNCTCTLQFADRMERWIACNRTTVKHAQWWITIVTGAAAVPSDQQSARLLHISSFHKNNSCPTVTGKKDAQTDYHCS